MTALKALRETCTPRHDVLSGELRDEMFAASLSEVVRGEAHEIYQDPDRFFSNTYPTARVRSFLNEVVGRLSGKDSTAAAFFRLDTPFGGGKTHTLISLYHLLVSQASLQSLRAMGVEPANMPSEPVKTVTIVGGDLNPADGVWKGEALVHHIWGEIAYQLGGDEGYELVRKADQQGIAPGPQFLDTLSGDSPILFMIDEPAEYMRRMGNSAGQLPAFLKTLSEWVTVSNRPRALVLTLAWNPESQQGQRDAFVTETEDLIATLDDTFKELQSVINRPARVVTPAQRQDIEPILRKRLFDSVDMTVAAHTADAYFAALREAAGRDTSLPSEVVQASYRKHLEDAYPFHPSFIEVLDGKLATVPNFQRTRGALRLVARVIRRMWENKQNDVSLVHPFCIDLSDPEIVEELVGRLDRPAYSSVVSYDVASPTGSAHAQEIDRKSFAGHPPYTQRVATALLVHSLPDPPARGANLNELLASTLTPNSDPAHLKRALEYLSNEAWHLDYEGTRYTFRTEPSLNKIVLDETQAISQHDARTEVDRRVRQIWRTAGLEVRYFPDATEDLADAISGRLVLMHWDTADITSTRIAVPAKVNELANYKGVQQDYRRYRNTLFFLVADADRVDSMLQASRRWLALDRLEQNRNRMDEMKLSAEHRSRLKNWHKEGELNVRVAITRAYRHLFYPERVDQSRTAFGHHALMVDDQGDGRMNHTETILNVLVEDLEKVKTASSGLRSPVRVKQETFGAGEGALALDTLVERYAERPRLPLIIAPTYFQEIVRAGVANKTWLYYDTSRNIAYDTLEPVADIVLDGEHMLLLPDEALSRAITVWKPEPQEKEDENGSKGTGKISDGVPGGGPREGESRTHDALKGAGEPRKALAEVTAIAKDQGWLSLASITLEWQGEGQDAHSSMSHLRTLMGQTSGAAASVRCELTCEFGEGGSLRTNYSGAYERYRSVAGTLETQASQAEKTFVGMALTLSYQDGPDVDGQEIADLRDALELVSLGHTVVTVERHHGGG